MAIEVKSKIPSFATEAEVQAHDLALRVLASVKPGTKFLVVSYGAVETLGSANWPVRRLRYFIRTAAGVVQDVTEYIASVHFLRFEGGYLHTTVEPWLVLNTVAKAVHGDFDAWGIAKDAAGAF